MLCRYNRAIKGKEAMIMKKMNRTMCLMAFIAMTVIGLEETEEEGGKQ